MIRSIYSKLLEWKASPHRKPLLVYGARQVGKTWLLKEFGKNEYKDTVYINFDTETSVHKYFAGSISPGRVITALEDHFGKKIIPSDTLLIFDEIQECQRAKDALKYFNEDAPQYHISAAGSFLGIAQGKFPVGQVDEITLRPLSFYEFLEAGGKTILLENIKNGYIRNPGCFNYRRGETERIYVCRRYARSSEYIHRNRHAARGSQGTGKNPWQL